VLPFETCCAPYILGARAAESPIVLLRTRFSAYARGAYASGDAGLADYLLKTAVQQGGAEDVARSLAELRFKELMLIESDVQEASARIRFSYVVEASSGGGPLRQRIVETSEFTKAAGRWLFVRSPEQTTASDMP